MSISSSSPLPYVKYTATGLTQDFTFPFRADESSWVKVNINGTPVGGYSVNGNTVTLASMPTDGDEILIYRQVPYLQPVDLVQYTKFPAETIEQMFDRLVMMVEDRLVVGAADLDMGGKKIINMAAGTSGAHAANIDQISTIISQTVTNLPDQTIYEIATKVAEILEGTVTPPSFIPPATPTDLQVTAIAAGSVTLTWEQAPGALTGHRIYRDGVLLVNRIAGDLLTYIDTNVQPNTLYRYRVSTINETYSYESARSNEAVASTPPVVSVEVPGQPTGLTATAQSQSSILLQWQYNSAVVADQIKIFRNGTSLITIPFGLSYVDNGLNSSTPYTYLVQAINSAGPGLQSAPASATTSAPPVLNPPAPLNVAAIATGPNSIRITWDYSSDLHDGFTVAVFKNGTLATGNAIFVPKANRSFDLPGLEASTQYTVIVSAIKIDGAEFMPFPAPFVAVTTQANPVPALVLTGPSTINARYNVAFGADYSASGGSGSYTFSITNVLPSGITAFNITGGYRIGGTPGANIGNTTHVVTVRDNNTGQTDSIQVSLSIGLGVLTLTDPGSIDLTAAESQPYDSGTWTIGGGPFPQMTVNPVINGSLPAGLSLVKPTTTTFKIAGTPTDPTTRSIDFVVSVASNDGQVINRNYTLQYTGVSQPNRAPVFTGLQGLTTVQVNADQLYPAGSPVYDFSTVFDDPDNDTLTYSVLGATNLLGQPITLASIGLALDPATGKLTGTIPESKRAEGPFFIVPEADDGINTPLTASINFTLQPAIGSPFPTSPAPKVTASGGSGSYTYAVVSGSIPSWLGSSINASTGAFTGGTGNVVAGTFTFTVQANDGVTTTNVVISIVPVVNIATNLAVDAVGTVYATDFTDVYINGVKQDGTGGTQDRTITSVGTTVNAAKTLRGEASGGINNDHIDWVVDPLGLQPRIARFRNLPTDNASSGSWVRRIDGVLSGNETGARLYNRLYARIRFVPRREVFGYRYATGGQGEMKIAYFGANASNGQVYLAAFRFTGFYHLVANISEAVDQNETNRNNLIPGPNPWNNVTSLRRKNTAVGNVGTPPVQSDGKIKYYEYYGLIDGSGVGLSADIDRSASNPQKYMDQRTHIIDGVNVGFPAAPVALATVPIYFDRVNVLGLFAHTKYPNPGTVQMWAGAEGSPPRMVYDSRDNILLKSDGWRSFTLCNYDTERQAEVGRPEGWTDYYDLVLSETPIRWPGGFALPNNLG